MPLNRHYSSVVPDKNRLLSDSLHWEHWLALAGLLLLCSLCAGQTKFSERLPNTLLNVSPPTARVTGKPGDMVYIMRSCPSIPLKDVRRRIVNTTIQEWAYFGYSVLDLVPTRESNPEPKRQPWRRTLIASDEALRVASSIAGYWAATPDSAWILEQQNQSWARYGSGSRWRQPWSAAFISWVMCESGIGETEVFHRAIAHHSYIDQAITATDQQDSQAAYRAFEPGEQQILPGDMLSRGYRPAYKTLVARRQQMGSGARTHCDIVIKLDPHNERIMLIGGNVRSWVRLKLLPAAINDRGYLTPEPYNGRTIFAHLQLQAGDADNDMLHQSPTFQSLNCAKLPVALRLIQPTLFEDCS